MAAIFRNISDSEFTLNGIEYKKTFIPVRLDNGDLVRVINLYDSRFALVKATPYYEYQVNGQTFNSVESLIESLNDLVYSRVTFSEEDKQAIYDELQETQDIVAAIGSGEGGKSYDSLADALAADIPDNVIFQTPEGIWRRDSSLPEGAVFLRQHPPTMSDFNEIEDKVNEALGPESFAGEFNLEQGTVEFSTGELLDYENRVRTSLFKGGGVFEVNEGFAIVGAVAFDENGNYLKNLTTTDLNREKLTIQNEYWTRVVFSNSGGDGNVLPSQSIIESSKTGISLISQTQHQAYAINADVISVDTANRTINISETLYLLVNGRHTFVTATTIDYSDISDNTKIILYDENEGILVTPLPFEETLSRGRSFLGFIRTWRVYINGKIPDISPTPPVGSALSHSYILDGRDFIIDTLENTITIPRVLYILVNNSRYTVVTPEVIDYSSISTTSKFIVYNEVTEKIEVISIDVYESIPDTYSFVGCIRSGQVDNVYVNGSYTLNGTLITGGTLAKGGGQPEPEPIETPRGQAYIISGQEFSINTAQETIEITIPLYVISNGVFEAIVEPKLIDYSTVSGSTVFILYNEDEKTIEVTGLGLSEQIPEGKSLIGTLRINQNYRNININGSYILDGVFISGGSYSQGDPDPTPIPEAQKNILVDTNYSYEGADIELPSSSASLYDSYDSLMARYPQYIQKKMIGQSRDVVSMSFDTFDKLPVNMRVDFPTTITEGELVTIENLNFYVEKVWEGSSSSIGSYILLNPVTESGISPTGVILNSEGIEITSYRSRRYSRYTLYLNGNSDHAIYVSESDYGAYTLQGVFETGTPSVPNSGNLTDSEGNVLATYTDLIVSDGSPVYCYYFDFSSNRDESEIKNRLFLLGGLHGNEKKSMAGQLTFFTELCDNWRGDKLLRELRNVRFSVIPAANPWGIDNNTTYNANGVDLNRNFEEGFTITDPLYFRWSGQSALSEPEAVAINEEIKNSLDTIFAFVDSHNDGSILGGFMSTSPENLILGNAVSRNINNNINQAFPYIPTYLFAWVNSGTTLWTVLGNPNQGDFALTNNRSLDNQEVIESVTDTTIIVGGVTYSRDENSDEDLTNLYLAYPVNITPPGATALQGRKLGITNSYIMEVGGSHFMTTEQSLKLQVDITTNVMGSISKYLLY